MNLSIFFKGLEDTLKVAMAVVPNDVFNTNVLGDGGEDTQEVSTLEIDDETERSEPS